MSDRAATELKFNELLESYREEVLPQVRADYNTMDDKEKETVTRLNNFFCGLLWSCSYGKCCTERII